MRTLLIPLALAGAIGACSDAGGVDPDAISGQEFFAVRLALDSAFRHDTTLDRSFTGDSGLYVVMSAVVFPFIDRASRIPRGADTTRVVGIEFDIDATLSGTPFKGGLTAVLAWTGYDSTTRTVDSVFFVLGSGRAPVNDSLWARFTLDTAGTGTGFAIHQAADTTVTKWQSSGGHLRTTGSGYGTGRIFGSAPTTITVFRGTLSGEVTITGAAGSPAIDFGSGSRAVKFEIRGDLP